MEEKDRISTVTKKLDEMHLLNDRETVLFTAAEKTKIKHASNSIEIHKIEELKKLQNS